MGRLLDWFARNRTSIGGILSSIYVGVTQIDPALVAANPRTFAYIALGLGILFGGGLFKSDSFQRREQGR